MDLSGARMAVELHALADSLSEEIDKLDSGDLDVQAQRMVRTLSKTRSVNWLTSALVQ